MVPFHRSQSALRLLRAPNQIGKTWAGCAEDWWFLTDTHPWRQRKPGPVKLWIMLADLENQYREFCEKFHGLEPLDVLAPGCKYVEGEGYLYRGSRQVMLKNGSQVVFRSGEGSQIAVSSGTADALHIDEPPKQPHFLEACRAVLHRAGPIWMTMTPVGRPVHWLKLRVEGDPEHNVKPSEPWEQHVPRLTFENCLTWQYHRPTRTQASIDTQIARYLGTAEYQQRCEGAWEGVATGRRFPGFNPALHTVPLHDVPTLDTVRTSHDWGESPGTQIGYVLGLRGSGNKAEVYVLAEIEGRDHSTPDTDAQDLRATLVSLGITLDHVDSLRGDVNSAGKAGAGVSINELFGAALGREVHAPRKTPGSIRAGETAINTALIESRLFVAPTCRRLLHSLAYYTGTESDLKHPLDALRYGIYDVLLAPAERGSKPPTLAF